MKFYAVAVTNTTTYERFITTKLAPTPERAVARFTRLLKSYKAIGKDDYTVSVTEEKELAL